MLKQLCVGCLGFAVLLGGSIHATEPNSPILKGRLDKTDWLKQPTNPLAPEEIDRLINTELAKAKVEPASRTRDEEFLRRIYLDLTGRLPMPADLSDFLADKSPDKRAKVIDRLLDSEDFAKHWARSWQYVISSRTTDIRALSLARGFENWLSEQIQAKKNWGEITKEIISAEGSLRYDEMEKNGAVFFVLSKLGNDATTERAAETSRIFLGIQLQCAQCHDHPSDVWVQKQFHEFAAYFARLKERPIREGMKQVGIQTFALPFAEHLMPGKDDPKKGTTMQPRFLDGQSPGRGLTDSARRKALADSIISKDNPWFAAAFVNRVWGELLGQSFYSPVDDLGPQKEAMMPEVIARVSASFRGSDYDIKGLYRTILNSETYQRQLRPGGTDEHLHFATTNPVRLNASSLWQTLVGTLGQLEPQRPGMQAPGPQRFFQGLEGQFKQEFSYDPSSKAEDVEASIGQALFLMNNPVINQKIQATGTNLLARILASYPQDDEALKMVYLRTLARRPTDRELDRCRQQIAGARTRTEAFEDILWALINSTEYQTRR